MKKVIFEEKPIEKFRLFALDFHDKEDRNALRVMLKNWFVEGENIFFSCIREQTLMSPRELLPMRKYVPEYFKNHGKYYIISRIDSSRFHCCGALEFNDKTIDFVFELCNYFLHMNFFKPKLSFTWDDLIKQKGLFFRPDSKPINDVFNNYIETLIMKGGDSDMLDVFRQP